jgi:hypothetical protein
MWLPTWRKRGKRGVESSRKQSARPLNVAANVRLRPHHHKHRSGVGQFRRILYTCRLEHLRWIFCQYHDMQGRKSFFGRGI